MKSRKHRLASILGQKQSVEAIEAIRWVRSGVQASDRAILRSSVPLIIESVYCNKRSHPDSADQTFLGCGHVADQDLRTLEELRSGRCYISAVR